MRTGTEKIDIFFPVGHAVRSKNNGITSIENFRFGWDYSIFFKWNIKHRHSSFGETGFTTITGNTEKIKPNNKINVKFQCIKCHYFLFLKRRQSCQIVFLYRYKCINVFYINTMYDIYNVNIYVKHFFFLPYLLLYVPKQKWESRKGFEFSLIRFIFTFFIYWVSVR